MPETVKYGISNFTVMGARLSMSWSIISYGKYGNNRETCLGRKTQQGHIDAPAFTLGSPKWALMRNSRLPPSCLIFHTKADLSGAYCTVPVDA